MRSQETSMRTLINSNKSSNLSDTEVPFIKSKLWSPKHMELEFQIDKSGRYPVLHMLATEPRNIVVGGSVETLFDFVLDMDFGQFTNNLGTYPKTEMLFKNTFDKNRNDGFLSRAIEPYSKELHWFLCVEVVTTEPISFSRSNFTELMERYEELFSAQTGIIELTDNLMDDLNPSTLQTIVRGFLTGAAQGAQIYFDQFADPPKWLEALKEAADWSEKIGAYSDRFCRDEFYQAFTQ